MRILTSMSYLKQVAVSLLLAATTMAGNLTLSSAGGRPFAKENGVLLPTGCLVRIGTFNLPEATRDETLRSTTDYATLNAWFRPLGESASGAGSPVQAGNTTNQLRINGFPSAGHAFGTISNIAANYLPTGTKLYVWVFDAATPRESTQWGIFCASDWLSPPTLGARSLATQSSELAALQGTTTESVLKLKTPADTFGNWRMRRFPADAVPSVLAFDADSDGDGIHNLAEYAWKLDPQHFDKNRSSLTKTAGAGSATFTFNVPLNLTDVAVTAECSPDLREWTTAASTVTATDPDFETRTAIAPNGNERCFWRVRFSAVTPP
jgi:hypothetical protein